MTFDTESLRAQLDAYKEFNQPDELAEENVGSSFDAQLAVQGVIGTIESRKALDRNERLNQAFVTAAISALPETNRTIDIQNPKDLWLARRIQANALWYAPHNQVHKGQYIAGVKQDGEQTSLLLVPQTRQMIETWEEDGDGVRSYTYPMNPYNILRFLTREFECAMGAAKEREVAPFSQEELLAMNHSHSDLELNVELDARAPSSILMWPDNQFAKRPGLRQKIKNKLTSREAQPSSTVLQITGHESVDTSRISDDMLRDFHVLDRIAELAASLKSVDAIRAKLSAVEQQSPKLTT